MIYHKVCNYKKVVFKFQNFLLCEVAYYHIIIIPYHILALLLSENENIFIHKNLLLENLYS